MISVYAAALAQSSLFREIVEADAKDVVVAVAIKLPTLGNHDRQVLEAIARVLPKGGREYPRPVISQVTGGRPVECRLLADSLLVWLEAPAAALKSSLSIANAILRNASLEQDDLDSAVISLTHAVPGYWAAHYGDGPFNLTRVSHDEAQAVYWRVFRPESVSVVLSGPAEKVDAEEIWAEKIADWQVPQMRVSDDHTVITRWDSNPAHVTTVDILGAPFPADDPSLPTRLLALYALGTGKTSSLYRICRERHRWSYRQEPVLIPTRDGWTPSLFVAMVPCQDALARIQTVEQELAKDVSGWTESDRSRALALAEGSIERGAPAGPLTLTSLVGGDSQAGRTVMAAYWRLKTGLIWNPSKLLQTMGFVRLDEFKQAASDFLTGAKIRVLDPQ